MIVFKTENQSARKYFLMYTHFLKGLKTYVWHSRLP